MAIVTMLADDAAIRAVLLDEPVLELARPGAVHVVTSTLSLDMIEELRAREDRYDLAFSDLSALRVAVDQELTDFDASIKGAREVAFFPPMTGG